MLLSLLFALIGSTLTTSNETVLLSENQTNKTKDEINTFNNNIPLESSLTMQEIYNDSTIVNLMSRAFRQRKLLIPKAINQRIVEYIFIHDRTINEFIDRIMNKLKEITEQQQIILNLHGSDFIFNLLRLITDNKEKIDSFQFWDDLERFLFKYALLMRKKFSDNDQLFEKSVENIKDIMIIVKERISLYLNIFDLQLMTNFDFSMFNCLVQYEIFDHPHLLELFVKNIIDKEANLIMTIDEIKKKYSNDNFNNNPLLKMMLIQFAFSASANEEMIGRGWYAYENIQRRGNRRFAIALHYFYSKGEGEHGYEISEIEALRPYYLSQSTIRFFLDKKLKFRIASPSNLVDFLRKLEYAGGLPRGASIDEIIGFKFKNDIYKWNKDVFERYLMKEKKDFVSFEKSSISPEEYQRYIKLIN